MGTCEELNVQPRMMSVENIQYSSYTACAVRSDGQEKALLWPAYFAGS